MNIGLILAGGSGSRMGMTELPKQFLDLGEKPIIIHTLEQFLINENIDSIVVSVNEDWINYTTVLVNKYIDSVKTIAIISGGKERSETVYKGAEYIYEHFENAVIVSHDSVRPFITQKIIDQNIQYIEKGQAVNTIIPSNDTIVEVAPDLESLKSIPERKYMYLGQTPQTFYAKDYIDLYNEFNEEELSKITDVCKMYVDHRKNVKYVLGSQFNMKITTQFDFKLANELVKGSFSNV